VCYRHEKMRMVAERYYLRNKRDQGLYVYLEIGETWEESFMMEFRMTEGYPHFVKTGALYEHRSILIAFKWIAISSLEEILRDKKIEWEPITPDEPLKYQVKNFKDSFITKT